MKKICIIALLFIYIVSVRERYFVLAENENTDVNVSINQNEAFYQNQNASLILYQKLIAELSKTTTSKLNKETNYSINGLYADQFPDSYAGGYINTEGNLVIMISKNSSNQEIEALQNTVEKVNESGATIIYQIEGFYRYSELIESMTNIQQFCLSEEYNNSEYVINGYGIIDNRNAIEIGIYPFNQKAIDYFSSCLEIENAYYVENKGELPAAGANCGDGIGKTANSMTFSIGYRAKYTSSGNTVNGFITCGHALSGTNTYSIYCSGGLLGSSLTSKYQYSGTVDACFVKLNSGSTVSSVVGNTNDTISGSQTMISVVGSIVSMYGKNSGKKTGTVQSISYTSNGTDGVTLTDQVKANYTCIQGDSGGIVYIQSSSSSSFYATGINARTATSYSIFCKAYNINSTLGVTIR